MSNEDIANCISVIEDKYNEQRNMSKKDILDIANACKIPASELAKLVILKKLK